MNRKRTFIIFISALLTLVVLSWGGDRGWAQSQGNKKELNYKGKVTYSEKKAAAKRAKESGLRLGVPAGAPMGAPAMPAVPSETSENDKPIK